MAKTVPREKLEGALREALLKIDKMTERFCEGFPSAAAKDGVYSVIENKGGWVQCFYTGMLILAYQFTGDEKYLNLAKKLDLTFFNRVDNMVGMGDHDIGFTFTLSTVATYKATGEEIYKEKSIAAARVLADRFREKGQFIQLVGNADCEDPQYYRLIIDCLMNINLLYFAGQATGEREFTRRAFAHFNSTMNNIVRADGSTFQNLYFDQKTGEVIGAGTKQGKDTTTAWARGQAWGVAGPALTYSYMRNDEIMDTYYKVVDYYISRLPEDKIAYWDMSYIVGEEPRDSSAASIAVCGLHEALKVMPLDDAHREKYNDTMAEIMESLIDNYTTKGTDAEGLLLHGTYYYAGKLGVDECCIFGDYFYLEALMRLLNPEWEKFW